MLNTSPIALGSSTSRISAADDVGDVAEAARLRAVAVDGDRLARQALPHEVRDHHAVAAGLARPDGIEEARDDHRQLLLFPVGQRQELVDRLAARVGPAVFRRRSHHEVGVFAEGHGRALAVDLGRRRDDDQLLLLVGVPQHDFGAVHVGLDRVDRRLHDQLHADGRGQVEDDVAVVDQLGQQRLVGDAVDRVAEPRVPLQVLDVLDRARREVVEHRHLMARGQQRLGQVRPDEPGAAGDECTHEIQCPESSRMTSAARRAAPPSAWMP